MRIGALRQRLDIQFKTVAGSTNDGHFEGNEVWQTWKSAVPCSVYVRRGQERFQEIGEGGQRYSNDSYHFTVRYKSVEGIDSTMRVLHRGNVFDIRALRPDGQFNRGLVIECEVQDAVIGHPPLIPAVLSVIPMGTVGQAYAGFTVTASGGTGPYTFLAESGGLPPGLDIDDTTGEISGTPTHVGEWPCDIIISDAAGASVPLSFTIVVTAASVAAYAYTVTAGQDSSWVGFIQEGFGSINTNPIAGGTIQSTVVSKAVPGEGGIEIVGDTEVLHAALIGKDVYVAGVKIDNPEGWTFQSGLAIWWVSSGFPSFDSGNDYQIEIK